MHENRRHWNSRLALPAFLVGSMLAASGCIERGFVRLGRPLVYDAEQTKAALAGSGKTVTDKVRKETDLKTVQESSSVAELIASSLRAGGSQASPGSTANASPPTPALTAAPLISGGAVPSFGRTIQDQINDFAHAENQAVAVDLLFSGKGEKSTFGPDARIYRVRFDMGIFPTRQSHWWGPFLGISTGFGSTYRFTESWFARIEFMLPHLASTDEKNEAFPGYEGRPLLFVYDIDPRYSVLTALESLGNTNQTQLALAYGTPAAAAQAEYLRRLEEQFAQQRRYPLQLGLIEDSYSFSWSFGPRRQIRERSRWRYLNPFLSKYKVVSRLEPGMRTGQALLVIPDATELVKKDRTGGEEIFGKWYCSPGDFGNDFVDSRYRLLDEGIVKKHCAAVIERAKGIGTKVECDTVGERGCTLRVPVITRATYVELDRPGQQVLLPIGGPEHSSVHLFELALPLTPPGLKSETKAKIKSIKPDGDKYGRVEIHVVGADFAKRPARKVKIRDVTRGKDLTVRNIELQKDDLVYAQIVRPAAPKAPADSIQIRASVETALDTFPYGGLTTYEKIWLPKDDAKKATTITMVPTSGDPGTWVKLTLGKDMGRNVAEIERLMFGLVPVKPGDVGWHADAKKRTVDFMVPRPPQQCGNQVECREAVDVVGYFKRNAKLDKTGPPAPLKIQRFEYGR